MFKWKFNIKYENYFFSSNVCVCEFGFSTILNLFAEYFLIVIIIGRGLT